MSPGVRDERRLRLLVERARLALSFVVGSNLLFAFFDLTLPFAERVAAWSLKVVALVTCAAGFRALRDCRTDRKARLIVWLMVLAAVATTSLSGIATGDATTTLILCVLVAWGTAVLLPLGALEQIPIALLTVVASLANALAVRGHLNASNDYPVIALIVGAGSSVYVAYLLDRYRAQVWAAEDALRTSEERWRLRVERAFDYIAELDMSGILLYASENHSNLGYDHRKLVGRNALELVHPEDRAAVTTALASVEKQGSVTVVTRFARADGEYRWLEISGRIFDRDDGTKGLVTVGRDVTERKQLELDLRAANSTLQESNRIKTYFAGTMAHELRNTFGSILGYIELVESDGVASLEAVAGETTEEPILKALGRVAQDGLDIITITLELSRGELGEREKTREVVALPEIFREIEDEIPKSTRKPDVELKWVVDGKPRLRTDPVKLKMVLKNLVTNAMKFTTRGSVTVSAAQIASCVEIRVSDTGAGIAAAALPTLFDPFTQAHGGRSRRMGAGLGLFIVRRLVEIMGGEIGASSVVGEGSVFTVKLPADTSTEVEPVALETDVTAGVKRALHVLVAEDNKVNQLFVEHLLGRQGHTVHVVENGRQALDALQEKDFDVLVVDLNMPVLDGLSVVRQLQSSPRPGRRPFVIAMTASDDERELNDLRAAGVAAFVGKPVDPGKLRAALAQVSA